MRICLAVIFILGVLVVNSQNIRQSSNWFKFISDTYELSSLNPDFQSKNLIEPQTEISSIKKNTAFYVPSEQGIVLFKNDNPATLDDVDGTLKSNSIIELQEIEYRRTFQNPDTTWKFTHEVWYKFLINGNIYYSDYKIHDISRMWTLDERNQIVVVANQRTGYDNFYDNGYPEKFHLLVFERQTSSLELIYDSQEIDLICNCEFWEPEAETYDWKEQKGQLFIKLNGLEETFTAIWNGEELVERKTTGNTR